MYKLASIFRNFMNKYSLLIFLLFSISVFSQDRIKLYDYDERDTIIYSIRDNVLYKCHLLDYNDKDSTCTNEKKADSATRKYKALKILIKKNRKVTYILIPKITEELRTDYAYDLPFKKGKMYRIGQGYNGRYTHQNSYALDFTMTEGTEILAAREGTVIAVVKNNKIGCPDKKCAKYGNYIQIFHPDGTLAEYYHFKYNGITVKLGDFVKKGDLIGFAGNTGWSYGPHLHFACYLDLTRRVQIKTLFRTKDGNRREYLYEGNNYSRKYD